MLSVREVAEALNITPMTVLRHINDPTLPLPAEKVGKQYVIFASDFEAWRAKRRPQGWPKGRPRTRPPA